MKHELLATALIAASALAQPARGAITLGTVSDFEDGTTQGWGGGAAPTNIADGGPGGLGDNFLQVGNGGNWATHNTGPDFSGVIGAGVTSIEVDMMRPPDGVPQVHQVVHMRLVLLGPGTGDRWTSSASTIIPEDGVWRTYRFSTLESDLIQVQGASSYAAMAGNVDRVMFRHDPTGSAQGTPLRGLVGLDNIRVIPEPASGLLGLIAGALMLGRRRR